MQRNYSTDLIIEPTLDAKIIREAFKKRVIDVHPDKFGGGSKLWSARLLPS